MEKLVKCIDELTIRLGVPQTLRDLGLPEGQFDAIAHDTMKDPQISWNPRPVSFSDVIELLERAW
jgi:alcohol dehydrogenase class IV